VVVRNTFITAITVYSVGGSIYSRTIVVFIHATCKNADVQNKTHISFANILKKRATPDKKTAQLLSSTNSKAGTTA